MFNSFGKNFYLLSVDKDKIADQRYSKPEKYIYKTKLFIEMLHEYILEELEESIISVRICYYTLNKFKHFKYFLLHLKNLNLS